MNRLIELLDECKELSLRKNHDYAKSDDPFANFRECQRLGISPYKGVLVRMSDKWSRVCNLSCDDCGPAVSDESVIDTLKDLANYALIAVALREEERRV